MLRYPYRPRRLCHSLDPLRQPRCELERMRARPTSSVLEWSAALAKSSRMRTTTSVAFRNGLAGFISFRVRISVRNRSARSHSTTPGGVQSSGIPTNGEEFLARITWPLGRRHHSSVLRYRHGRSLLLTSLFPEQCCHQADAARFTRLILHPRASKGRGPPWNRTTLSESD